MEALQAVKQFRLRELAAVLKTLPDASPQPKIPNPFLPRKNPESGRWAPAKYSLRRQAELIKHAKASNTLHLLPPGPKLGVKQLATAASAQGASVSEELWAQSVEWEGEVEEKEVSGTEHGSKLYANRRRMFKGHKWERTRQAREEERRKAMEHMDRRIVGFREVRIRVVHLCYRHADCCTVVSSQIAQPGQCSTGDHLHQATILDATVPIASVLHASAFTQDLHMILLLGRDLSNGFEMRSHRGLAFWICMYCG